MNEVFKRQSDFRQYEMFTDYKCQIKLGLFKISKKNYFTKN